MKARIGVFVALMMNPVAKGIWSLLFLVALVLALAFLLPPLIHLLIELPQRGWEMVS